MKKIVMGAFVLAIAACNNAAEEKQVTAEDSVAAVVPNDSSGMVRADDLKTAPFDTVFADGSIPSSWADAGISDSLALRNFVVKLQQWTAAGEKDSIAAVTRFPLRKIKSKQQFLDQYGNIFTPSLKNEIAKQNLRQIFHNQDGVTLSQGAIWIVEDPATKKLVISAINP